MKSAQLSGEPVFSTAPQPPVERSRPAYLATIFLLAALGVAIIASAYWPGVMIDDARWQYQQSVDNAYEDWHPPLMAWIWHQSMHLMPGPGPMLLLQLALYWFGIGLIAAWLERWRSPRLGIAAACAGWMPIPLALMGSVIKDCLMAGILCSASGLLLWAKTAKSRTCRQALGVATIVVLLVASALRANAFLACAPLALAALPKRFTSTAPRLVLTGLSATFVFFATPAAVSAALHAEDTDSQLSLIIFDLGGITEHTGVSQFPNLRVANPVAVNHRCYDPFEWDSYSTWARRPCPLGFARFQSLVDEGDVDPRMVWLRAIATHPIAYAYHRLAHFNLSTWFLVPNDPLPAAWTQSVTNPWNFQVRPNPILHAVDTVANATARTPLGWPIFWLALSSALLIICRSARLDVSVTAIASSAFLYGAGYLIFGVATGMRYYVWTITGAALAAILAAREMSRGAQLDRRSAIWATAMILVPTAMAITFRLFL